MLPVGLNGLINYTLTWKSLRECVCVQCTRFDCLTTLRKVYAFKKAAAKIRSRASQIAGHHSPEIPPKQRPFHSKPLQPSHSHAACQPPQEIKMGVIVPRHHPLSSSCSSPSSSKAPLTEPQKPAAALLGLLRRVQ
jgi:hypothetical protein